MCCVKIGKFVHVAHYISMEGAKFEQISIKSLRAKSFTDMDCHSVS